MSIRTRVVIAVAGAAVTFALLGVATVAWLTLLVSRNGGERCASDPQGKLATSVPAVLRPIFAAAAMHYELGPAGPAVLAALTSVESRFGRDLGPSSAGAVGWTQFMPATWKAFGVDANGDGKRDPANADDAIFSAARYLRANGAPANWYMALFAYNHASWYVSEVLDRAQRFAGEARSANGACNAPSPSAGVQTAGGPRGLARVRGAPGMRVDARIVPDVESLIHDFHVAVTAAYATSGHAPDGEHPLGLAVDLVPGRASTWDDVDRLARWAEPVQNAPRPPFRWVGYDGDPGHGRGNHLHLSWSHSAAPVDKPPRPRAFADENDRHRGVLDVQLANSPHDVVRVIGVDDFVRHRDAALDEVSGSKPADERVDREDIGCVIRDEALTTDYGHDANRTMAIRWTWR